jgi:hypothetical protein
MRFWQAAPEGKVFEQETPTRLKEATNRSEQESDGL